jgi:hypothetical protein
MDFVVRPATLRLIQFRLQICVPLERPLQLWETVHGIGVVWDQVVAAMLHVPLHLLALDLVGRVAATMQVLSPAKLVIIYVPYMVVVMQQS